MINKTPFTTCRRVDQTHKILAFYHCFYNHLNTIYETIQRKTSNIQTKKIEFYKYFSSEDDFYKTIFFYSQLFTSDPSSFDKQWNELSKLFKK